MKNKISNLFVYLIILIISISIVINVYFSNYNLENVKSFITSFGFFSPIVLISLVLLQVLFAPIPGQLIGIVSGYLYGPIFGTLYSMIGLTLGTWLVLYLVRIHGRPYVKDKVNNKVFNKFDRLIEKHGLWTLFLIYLLPAFPDDLITYIAGLTKISIRKILIISILGRFPGFLVLNLVGAGIGSDNYYLWSFIGLFVVLSFLYIIYNSKVERLMNTVVEKLNKDG